MYYVMFQHDTEAIVLEYDDKDWKVNMDDLWLTVFPVRVRE